MIANYGYTDAEGAFYITIDTGRCAECAARPCVGSCPRSLLVEEEDPYGDVVVAVDDAKRRKLRYECMACKPAGGVSLPCAAACPAEALKHTW